MKYESSILKRLVDTYGVVGNPRYISEIIKEFIVRGKERFPELFTYQSDWLAHIDEFGLNPTYTVSYTGQSIYAPNTLERPVKSAILKGQTLVNLIHSKDAINNSKKYVTIKNFSENKQYIAIFPYITNAKYAVYNMTTGTFIITYTTSNKLIFTSPSPAYEVRLYVAFDDTTTMELPSNALDIVCVEYQEGMENWDVPYFEGMQSVKMPVLKTFGKNLFDKNNIEENKALVWGSGITFNEDGSFVSDFIPVSPQKYVVSGGVNSSIQIFGYDVNKNMICVFNAQGNEQQPGSSQSYNNAINVINSKFIRIGFRRNNSIPQNKDDIQVEQGTQATTYEPYKSNILTVNEDVTLRGIGDVQDTLDLLTGEVTERIGEIVLDGNRGYTYSGDHVANDEYVTFHTYLEENQKPSTIWEISVSDKMEVSNEAGLGVYTKECIYPNSNFNVVYIRVKKSRLVEVSPNGFKKWIADNVITLQYKLATESVKTVDLTILDQNGQGVEQLKSFNGGTHVYTSSLEGSLVPSVDINVVTNLEETLKMCSLDGNTL